MQGRHPHVQMHINAPIPPHTHVRIIVVHKTTTMHNAHLTWHNGLKCKSCCLYVFAHAHIYIYKPTHQHILYIYTLHLHTYTPTQLCIWHVMFHCAILPLMTRYNVYKHYDCVLLLLYVRPHQQKQNLQQFIAMKSQMSAHNIHPSLFI